ncbi:hypothetical protein NDU88_006595 [Pleurodeles waltl]|uniref:Uncharacterized protein n=1 Tax=Pleurodeles waltl TaxID=8319 RepID=A0AAV7VS06_PLEWA|nr:hypothetical protein NDU88_006595 [Pleurodeles waltl]
MHRDLAPVSTARGSRGWLEAEVCVALRHSRSELVPLPTASRQHLGLEAWADWVSQAHTGPVAYGGCCWKGPHVRRLNLHIWALRVEQRRCGCCALNRWWRGAGTSRIGAVDCWRSAIELCAMVSVRCR